MTDNKKSEQTDEEYLDLFKISDDKYLIGIFQDGITIHKQQIRSLNIFQALVNTGKIKPGINFRIAIVGGGVAGLTFAAAALKSNIKVVIIEKEQYYLHMQYGCDIRKIHPNIYEWPEQGSNFPNTELPILNWRYDSASNVALQIFNGFNEIKNELNSTTDSPRDYLRENWNCKKIQMVEEDPLGRENKFLLTNADDDNNDLSAEDVIYTGCDLMIFAIGYGIEKGLDFSSEACSYWRNDAIGQSFLEKSKKFFISGTGDGGLMDLFRLLIHNFNYDYILGVIENNDGYTFISKQLLEIKKRGIEKKYDSKQLYKEFLKRIPYRTFKYIIDTLKSHGRIRNKIDVTLNASALIFDEALDFKKISILNAFLAYMFYSYRMFKYRGGYFEYDTIEQKYYLGKILLDKQFQDKETYYYIMRNGTDRKKIFDQLPLTDDELIRIGELKINQENTFNYGVVKPRWTVGELSLLFDKNRLIDYEIRNLDFELESKKRIEYFTMETSLICSNFLSILSGTIKKFNKANISYRMSMHRVVSLQGKDYFQQITPYFTEKATTGKVGKVFPLERGNVGLSIQTGKAIKITNRDGKFKQLLEKLGLGDEYEKINKSKSFVTFPISARINKNNSRLATNLVLFMDSVGIDFFDNADLIETIISATQGFINHIEAMIESKQILMKGLDFKPVDINPIIDDDILTNPCFNDLSVNYDFFQAKTNTLRFNKFYSFDIVYNTNIQEPQSFI